MCLPGLHGEGSLVQQTVMHLLQQNVALQYCMSKKYCPYLYSESMYEMEKTFWTYITFLNTNTVRLLINKNINTPMDNCQKDGQTETDRERL